MQASRKTGAMTVYVDPLVNNGWVLYGKLVHSCHMWADMPEELHALAARIGLKREWAQEKGSVLHYDLTPSKREAALKEGAVALSLRDAVANWRKRRNVERELVARSKIQP